MGTRTEAVMSGPILFTSRSRVRPGKLEGLVAFLRAGLPAIQASKPQTLAMLSYLDDASETLTIHHLFADAAGFAAHLQGVAERSAGADEFIETIGYEIAGQPSTDVVATMRGAAAHAGVELRLEPDFVGGFIQSAQPR
jgi:hypothetical protein